jgi:hypothetical protein
MQGGTSCSLGTLVVRCCAILPGAPLALTLACLHALVSLPARVSAPWASHYAQLLWPPLRHANAGLISDSVLFWLQQSSLT